MNRTPVFNAARTHNVRWWRMDELDDDYIEAQSDTELYLVHGCIDAPEYILTGSMGNMQALNGQNAALRCE